MILAWAASLAGTGVTYQARRPWKLHNDHEWQGFAPGEKQAYLFAHGGSVYAARLGDFYWWENHKPERL